jgi:hypothetical protein
MPRDCAQLTVQLSKVQLLHRLDERSRKRYDAPFSEGVLNDLIKDGLLPALERSKNEGLKPVYEAGASHYRRALQIKRLLAGWLFIDPDFPITSRKPSHSRTQNTLKHAKPFVG